jgi:hypothetical protein
MTFDEAATGLATKVRATGHGYLTMRRDEVRDAFEIGRLTEGQANAICEALGRHGVYVFPHPFSSGLSLRLYQQDHPVARIAEAVTRPDMIPETALRQAADVFAREKAGRDLRSDDAPWLPVFDMFLQLVLGREPEGWEEMRDDRPRPELAAEVGTALGLSAGTSSAPSTLHVAAAVCAFRPRSRRWLAPELAGPSDNSAAVLPLLDSLHAVNRHLQQEHDRLLRQAARLFLQSEDIPTTAVELGCMGLRYRREDSERGPQ